MASELPNITHTAVWHDRIPRYACLASLVEGKRVLDVGCGSGDGAAFLAAAGAREVVAIDPSSAHIDAAKQRYQAPNLLFLARYVEDPLDFGPQGVDLETGTYRRTDVVAAFERTHTTPLEVDAEVRSPSIVGPLETEEERDAQAASDAAAEAETDGDEAAPAAPSADEVASAPSSDGEAVDTSDLPAEPPAADVEPSEGAPTEAAVGETTTHLFDVVLALDPGLPVHDTDFLVRLASMLAPGGVVVVAARVSSRHGIADLLSTLEAGGEAAELTTFANQAAMQACFEQVFAHDRIYQQFSSLATHFVPPDGRLTSVEAARVPTKDDVRFALVFLSKEPLPERPTFSIAVPMEPVLSQLCAGVEALVGRTLSLEHRSVVFEEELTAKDALIDDLERETRFSNQRARELEGQVRALRNELDGLQGELTAQAAQIPPPSEMSEQTIQAQGEQLKGLSHELEHQQAVAARLREAVDVQRATIDAYTAHLTLLRSGAPPAPISSSVTGPREVAAPREATPPTFTNPASEATIRRLEAELATARGQADALTSQLGELRTQLAAAQQEAKEQSAARRRAEQDASGRQAKWEKEARSERAALRAELEALEAERDALRAQVDGGDSTTQKLQARLAEQEGLIAELRLERETLQRQVARFRRGRRNKRAGVEGEGSQDEG